MHIGRRGSSFVPGFFDGIIDELDLFNRKLELEHDEILGMWAAGEEGKCPCTPAPHQMTAWWTLDSSPPFDEIDHDDGMLHGDPAQVQGKVNSCLELDGGGDFVRMTSTTNLNPGEDGFSIDAWIRTCEDCTTGPIQRLVDKMERGGTPQGYTLGDQVTGPFTPDAGPWDNAEPLFVGAQPGGAPNFFAGWIDEVELFQRALVPDEITALFEADSRGKCRFPCVDFTPDVAQDDADEDGWGISATSVRSSTTRPRPRSRSQT